MNPLRRVIRQTAGLGALVRPAFAGLLCVMIALPADVWAVAPAGTGSKSKPAAVVRQIAPEQKTLHALNRLTFGPRPGDVAAVDRMGLDAWFQQQLHPETIPDAALDARLAQFPAMRLSQAELVERFPTPGMLRQFTRGSLLMPDDPLERAVYADASRSYEEKVEAKQAKAQEMLAQGGSPAEKRGPGMDGAAQTGGATAMAAGNVMSVGNTDAEVMSTAEKQALLDLPPAARWQHLVAMTPEQMAELQSALKGPEQARLYAGFTPEQTEMAGAMKSPERVIGAEVLSARLLRDVYSERQLQAVMADFWLNHFSVYLRKDQNEPYLLPAYEREAILPNALGRFEDLLVATAKSPAMLVYLDNWQSVGPNSKVALRAQAAASRPGAVPKKRVTPQGINENYARELMELHTLGVKGGYTQQDVIEVAKCFTGWTIDRPNQGGEFWFNPNRHEPGSKTVLGHVIPEGGMNEGLEVLHLLATSPATAHFVSLKLAERFVSDTPPPALVDRMTATFLRSDGDLKAVLTTMFHSPEFWSPDVYRAKVKTPVEFVASALRATNAEVSNPVPLVQALDRLGMPIYGMQTPNGYSWQADAWVSSNALLTRMNFALVLAGNRVQGTKVDWPGLLGGGVNSAAAPDERTEVKLEDLLLGQAAAAQTRQAALAEASTPGVQQQAEQNFRATPARSADRGMQAENGSGAMLRVKAGRGGANANAPETPLATMAGLLLGSPDFQRR